MTTTQIALLGPVRVRFDGVELTPPGRKLKTVIAVLALRAGQEVRRDELIEELGLIRSTRNAINTLHAHMTRLRRWIDSIPGDPGLLVSVPAGYRLMVDPPAVDALRFEQQVERATNLKPETPWVVSTMLTEALDLWRGDPLSDVADSSISAAAADHLGQLRKTARELLLEAWLRLGRDQVVVMHARRYIADDPLNERIRAVLIVALRRLGRHAEAIEAYHQAEQVLQQELGIRPGVGLRSSLKATTRMATFVE